LLREIIGYHADIICLQEVLYSNLSPIYFFWQTFFLLFLIDMFE